MMYSQKSHNILRESHTGELWSQNTGYGAKEGLLKENVLVEAIAMPAFGK